MNIEIKKETWDKFMQGGFLQGYPEQFKLYFLQDMFSKFIEREIDNVDSSFILERDVALDNEGRRITNKETMYTYRMWVELKYDWWLEKYKEKQNERNIHRSIQK